MAYLYKDKTIPIDERVKNLLSLMTLKEKVGQLNQRLYGFSVYERKGNEIIISEELKQEVETYSGLGILYGLYRADPWSGKNYENGLTGTLAPKAYNLIQNYVMEHSRLGIPVMMSSECPHGHQALDGYLLPVNLCVGAAFNPDLLYKAYKVCGRQLKDMGVNMALISVLDVLRDPRWGRSEECYSEDPYLSAELAKAAVKGIQDNDIIAVAKHFCAQGEGTGGINASAARIGERELREIHLPSAKACCQAGVKGIMAAYNEIDGIPCHTNKKLLTDILRGEMGFDGIVMADGLAIDQLDRMTGDNILSGALALKAGVDVSLWDNGFAALDKAHLQGLVTLEEIDRAAFRVLKAKFEQGLFENPYIEEKDTWTGYKVKNNPETLMLARESVVLLKNDEKILPINPKSNKKIAVIGPNADAIYHQLGDYTPLIKKEDGITVLKGIKDVVQGKDAFQIRYCKGCENIEKENNQIKEAVELASESDCVILVLGGSSSRFQGADFDANGAAITSGKVNMDCGEGVDCADLGLPGLQNQLAEALFKTGKPIITILIQGRPYAVNEISAYSKALLCAFYPGIVGGQAIAEILFGLISPSGRLPVSVPRHSGQLPVYYNYKNSYTAMNYYDNEKTSLYSFGYGLSYTKFSYSEVSLSYWNLNQPRSFFDCKSMQKKIQRRFYGNRKIKAEGIYFSISSDFLRHFRLQGAVAPQNVKKFKLEELKHGCIQLQFSITNLGDYDSFAVPQLYIKDIQSSTIRRVKELKAFKKVWIPKGESRNCCLELNEEKLAIWNDSMQFLVEPGEIQLYLSDCGKDLWTSVITIDN